MPTNDGQPREPARAAADDATLSHDAARRRYELLVDGRVAGYAEYSDVATGRLFSHTEILPEHEGKGYGGRLVRFALDDVRAHGGHVIPVCPFVAAYLRRHPDQQDLLTDDARRAFGV